MTDTLKVGLAQIAPVWLNRVATTEKVVKYIRDAGTQGCDLVAFGEAVLPGYPFWLALTDGAKWNQQVSKEIHAHYIRQAVDISRGDLNPITAAAQQTNTAVYLGIIERAADRGKHSLYCSLVYIDKGGAIQSVHRKLMPTFDERLAWSVGDGNGLRTHGLGDFTVGGLNCWENWMPLPRAALYAQGEDLHVMVWPGSKRNTYDITKFAAKEGRSYVLSVSGLMRASDFPNDTPHYDAIMAGLKGKELLTTGGSCIVDPAGEWVVEPQEAVEVLVTAVVRHGMVLEERQNFDPAGHYSRPDVTQLVLNRTRQSTLRIVDAKL